MTTDTPPTSSSPSFFEFSQNNSGGSFRGPATSVFVQADTLEEACNLTRPHFTLCGDSGRYADYDDCGCCPCCGHRWSTPWSDKPDSATQTIETINRKGLKYFGEIATALIKPDGSILIGNTQENLDQIINYITNASLT